MSAVQFVWQNSLQFLHNNTCIIWTFERVQRVQRAFKSMLSINYSFQVFISHTCHIGWCCKKHLMMWGFCLKSGLLILHAGWPTQPGGEALCSQSLRADAHAGAHASRNTQATVRLFHQLLCHWKGCFWHFKLQMIIFAHKTLGTFHW